MRRSAIFSFLVLASFPVWGDVPATPVMTLYQFNGSPDVPYYEIDSFLKNGPKAPAGTLAQGTSLIPCLVMRNGKPVTDDKGTPYVGFTVVVDASKAGPESSAVFEAAWEERRAKRVSNHHCDNGIRHVINIRKLMSRQKAPFFDPPPADPQGDTAPKATGLDGIVRAFHNSPQCADANRRLTGRRAALAQGWDRFIDASADRWPETTLARAKHLDYTMRTAIYEGHLERGCSAYGACERNIIALSIRNRARGQCLKWQGCRFPGDFQGVASKVSQYNIWDEYLTQISGLTSCFLRDDLADTDRYAKLQALYEQSVGDAELILYGSDEQLAAVFNGAAHAELQSMRHYYHPPAMGKCFPDHDRVEYISGAVARNGKDFVLIANTRVRVDDSTRGGYFFRDFVVDLLPERDVVEIVDTYPGFVLDGRKVGLRKSSSCVPYGVPSGCRFDDIGRYRKTPSWLKAGKPLQLACRVQDRGARCESADSPKTAKVGGVCDTEMQPVAGVK